MKSILRSAPGGRVLAMAATFAAPQVSFGVILTGYDFGPDGSTPSLFSATTFDSNVVASDITADSGAVLDGTNPVALPASAPYLRVTSVTANPTPAAAVAANADITFTATAQPGFVLDLTLLTFDAERGGASTPRGYEVRSSADGFATSLGTAEILTARPIFTNVPIDLTGAAFQGLSSITFRIYHYSPATGSSVDYDNIFLNGTARAIPEPAMTSVLAAVLLCLAGTRWRPAL